MLERGQELSARYVLLTRLGRGAYGEVWLAQDRERRERVALKILSAEWMQRSTALAALEREFDAIGRLDHPHILRVHGLYRTPQYAWIAMEYAAGGDLTQLRGRTSAEVLRAAIPVASALAHAHAAGLVHRDVKPANVLLSADGTPRLADFGIAAIASAEQPLERGSPFSMSPQQLASESPAASDDVYAFGATLYELLSGYPPFYPDARVERILTERPAALPESVPEGLKILIERMLAKVPAERPATMDSVERDLKILAASEQKTVVEPPAVRLQPPGPRAPGAPGEPLRGEWRRPTAAAANEQQLRREGFRRGLGVSAVVLGLIAVAIVFFALPRWVEQRQPTTPVAAATPAKPEPAVEQDKKEIDFAALARAKQEAEDLRAAIDARLQELRKRAVDVWGGAEIQQTNEALAAGDKDIAAREYLAAVERFKTVEPLLEALEARAGEVLKAQLDLGARALQDGRSADARNAFELATKIDPNNQVAAQGLKRAGTLDEVLGLLAAAERTEKEGQQQGALERYRKALALDAQAPRAAAAIARIEASIASDAFASAMAQGFSALARSDHAAARSAFEAARKIRPNAPEVGQALRQIEQEQRTGVIGTKLRAAQTLETQEQWSEALKEYRAVLELDSTVAAANEGVARVAPRAELNEQLELYLTQPERLFSQPVRAAAHQSLERAQAIANPGPVLQGQIAKLSEWLTRAAVPVAVALQSDNQTQVTIYRVGALGAFEQRSLELVPGTYTVVGTRPGYRDVRRQINVLPGAPLEPIVIRCEDRI
jgi:tetratricopeptide (TPR) repeat protein